jgi:transposase-like protein
MPSERLAMRRVRDVIKLKEAGLAVHEIARRVGAAPSTVRETLRRIEAAGLAFPPPEELTDAALEARLFRQRGHQTGPPPARRARLAGYPPRAEAQARDADDRVG